MFARHLFASSSYSIINVTAIFFVLFFALCLYLTSSHTNTGCIFLFHFVFLIRFFWESLVAADGGHLPAPALHECRTHAIINTKDLIKFLLLTVTLTRQPPRQHKWVSKAALPASPKPRVWSGKYGGSVGGSVWRAVSNDGIKKKKSIGNLSYSPLNA